MTIISGATGSTYTYVFNINDFSNGVAYLKGVAAINGRSYEDRITLSYVIDGTSGEPGKPGVGYTYAIESSLGQIINIDNIGSATTVTITGKVFYNVGGADTVEIDPQDLSGWEWYYRKNNTGDFLRVPNVNTNSFTISLDDFAGGWNNLDFYFKVNTDADISTYEGGST